MSAVGIKGKKFPPKYQKKQTTHYKGKWDQGALVWFEMGLMGNSGAGLSLCSSAFVWETFLQIPKCRSDLVCTVNIDRASGDVGGGGSAASGEGEIAGREGTAFLEQREFGPVLQGWVLWCFIFPPASPARVTG